MGNLSEVRKNNAQSQAVKALFLCLIALGLGEFKVETSQ